MLISISFISKLYNSFLDLNHVPIRSVTGLSEDKRYPIENLIDDDHNTFYLSSSIPTPYPWIEIELMNISLVEHLKITNRKDCCGERLASIEIRVGNKEMSSRSRRSIAYDNELCARYSGPAKDGETVWVSCRRPISGKYITIQTQDDTIVYMNIAEIEVVRNLPGKLSV